MYDTPPYNTSKTAKAVTLIPEMVDKLVVGNNRIAVEIHGGESGVQFFDALVQTNIETPFSYGSEWSYYDVGDMPKTYTLGEIVNIRQIDDNIQKETMLYQNYPNPFNPSTTIRYRINKVGRVSLGIYDILGQKLQTLVDETQPPGTYELTFDSSNIASGIYIYVLKTESIIEKRKMVVIK
jgi:hypothetical protein